MIKDVLVIENALEAKTAQSVAYSITHSKLDLFDRYDNPFEQKWTMRKDTNIALIHHDYIYDMLMAPNSIWWIQRLLDVEISHADWTHYGGIFVYDQGDYLKPHLDAGMHPVSKLTKVATACLYLTPATLEFWHGEPSNYSKPQVYYRHTVHDVEAGTLILFTNTLYAWHSVPVVESEQSRVVITCSYLAPSNFSHPQFNNNRTRAYFGRMNDEPHDPVLEILREQRASEEGYKNAYRTNT